MANQMADHNHTGNNASEGGDSSAGEESNPSYEGLVGELRLFFADNIRPNLISFSQSKDIIIWALALVVGAAAAYAAILFRLMIGVFQYPWLATTTERVFETARHLPWYMIVLAPTIGGLLVGLLLIFMMPGRRAFGVADVIEAQAIRNSRLSLKEALGGALVTVLSLGSGASAGREGPVVHLGASIASWLQQHFRLSHSSRRTILGCGVAAAVSASFNVPLAGVLFAHEVILGHYAPRAFVPIAISSAVGAVIVRTHLGNFPAFIIPEYQIASNWEFPAFALLGLFCALVAILFQLMLIGADRVARSVEIPVWLRPVIGGFLVGCLALLYPQVLGVGYDATDNALKQQFALGILFQLLIAKALATSITLASRFGGGVFSPSLYLGAMAGGSFGIIVSMIFPQWASSHGLYAITGMGAVAASILGAPISTILIAFELTGDYNVTIALLLAVSISSSLHRAFLGHSFFHWQLMTRGLFFNKGPHSYILHTLKVSQFMAPLQEDEDEVLPGTDEDEEMPWLSPTASIEQALRSFDHSGLDRIPVVDQRKDAHVIIGWATKEAALRHFNQALIESHEEHNS